MIANGFETAGDVAGVAIWLKNFTNSKAKAKYGIPVKPAPINPEPLINDVCSNVYDCFFFSWSAVNWLSGVFKGTPNDFNWSSTNLSVDW